MTAKKKKDPLDPRQAWRTPPALLRAIEDAVDANIVLDCAASRADRVAHCFIGTPGRDELGEGCVDVDALQASWANAFSVARMALVEGFALQFYSRPRGAAIWYCNPPFVSFPKFIEPALEATRCGTSGVMLGPIATDTRYFRKLYESGLVRTLALHGRQRFGKPAGYEDKIEDDSGPSFGVALYFFGLRPLGSPDRIALAALEDSRLVLL